MAPLCIYKGGGGNARAAEKPEKKGVAEGKCHVLMVTPASTPCLVPLIAPLKGLGVTSGGNRGAEAAGVKPSLEKGEGKEVFTMCFNVCLFAS